MSKDMESQPLLIAQYANAFEYRRHRKLLRVFWLVAFSLLIFELFFTNTTSLESNLGAIFITIAALIPAYLWCSKRALGIPIFPVFALTFVWTYALPLVSNHPKVLQYSPESHLFASITVTAFLLLGTFIWFQFVKSAPPIPKLYLTFKSGSGNVFLLFVLAFSILFNFSSLGGWLLIDSGIFALLRGIVLGLSALATFVLSYYFGTKQLSKAQSLSFLFLIAAAIITNSVGLLLVGAASQFLIAITGFVIGSKKIPTLLIIIILLCFSFLNSGKGEMRAKYWFGVQSAYVQPWDYPAWYSEWAGYSLNSLLINQNNFDLSQSYNSSEKASFLERASVIHMLLLTQNKSPQEIPYLYGASYAIVPQLLVPRIFGVNKIASHEGTYLLNIHYGLQTREATFRTTIGWGLLAESYANFGLFGCGGLAIVLGLMYGQVTRWSINAPVLSANYLFAVLVLTLCFQTEFSAGVYVAALFQASISLSGVIVLLMRPYKAPNFLV
ncbi:hypothetical protein H6G41_23470 [Tolypothrix sp. FACHB-123]|uniref:hypothetical protein n=1 Tax=Tolypothrix sp. FACHB-123 TaxID=2692868 RepID=UPI001688DA67|nr:hypothetical protein [Tolypothrix sp. FACHB-123]MBD2357536.1 hypothetical protein [Tolypothrix sp. FACHB-123]